MNIEKIEVVENNLNFIISPKNLRVLIDGNYYPITKEKIDELITIISTWDNEYSDNSYLDGNRFLVKVYADGEIDKMCGVRGIPSNYEAFKEYVRSIYDGR